MKSLIAVIVLILGSTLAFSQAPIKDSVPTAVAKTGAIFIKGDADFAVAISAAMRKKDVPATVVLDEKKKRMLNMFFSPHPSLLKENPA